MAETCIVCLSSLRQQCSPSPSHPAPSPEVHAKRSLRNTRLTSKSIDDDEEIVACLRPCKHILHNACLKPWVERANSCPTCRATFNTVELSATVGGEVIDTYTVEDKVQEVVYDEPYTIFPPGDDELIDEVDFDAASPCIICEQIDESHGVMYCDGCDATVHVFCAGHEDTPDIWYCPPCLAGMGGIETVRQRPMTSVPRPQRQYALNHPQNDRAWARVWQAVQRRLDFDLDFPFREEQQRSRGERRQHPDWQRRSEIARHQGAGRQDSARLRSLTSRMYQPPPPRAEPQPARDTEDVIRAWNAAEKARDSLAEQPRRKRPRSESPAEEAAAEQRQLKRPRFRRPPTNGDIDDNIAESSASAAQRAAEPSTFLSTLLREVEQKPVSAASPGASTAHSPRNISPARSTSPSGQVTPRANSVTPPPQRVLPVSPPLSSTILPPPAPPGFTFTPLPPRQEDDIKRHQRGRAAVKVNGVLNPCWQERTSEEMKRDEELARTPSPPHPLSLASKEEIQRMVKLALGPRYRNKELTKDQYTDINRDVSRRLYELVGDAAALSNERGRAKWQKVAEGEVQKAITTLNMGASTAAQSKSESATALLNKEALHGHRSSASSATRAPSLQK